MTEYRKENPSAEVNQKAKLGFLKIAISAFALMISALFIYSYFSQFAFKTYEIDQHTNVTLKIMWGECHICPADPPVRLQAKFGNGQASSDWMDANQWMHDYRVPFDLYARNSGPDRLDFVCFDGLDPADDELVNEIEIWVDVHTMKQIPQEMIPSNLRYIGQVTAAY